MMNKKGKLEKTYGVGERFCKGCGYPLNRVSFEGVEQRRGECPECGERFNLDNVKTYVAMSEMERKGEKWQKSAYGSFLWGMGVIVLLPILEMGNGMMMGAIGKGLAGVGIWMGVKGMNRGCLGNRLLAMIGVGIGGVIAVGCLMMMVS